MQRYYCSAVSSDCCSPETARVLTPDWSGEVGDVGVDGGRRDEYVPFQGSFKLCWATEDLLFPHGILLSMVCVFIHLQVSMNSLYIYSLAA